MTQEEFLHHFEQVRGRTMNLAGCSPELADGREAILTYMETMHAESMAIFHAFTEAQWNGKGKSPDGHEITVWKLLRAMLEHEIHHRGQMYVYLGILNVKVPSLFGTNEAELRNLSK